MFLSGWPGTREVPERGQRISGSQGAIDESLPEWFDVLNPAEDSTSR